jgi:RNA polymerase sigma-54 factor
MAMKPALALRMGQQLRMTPQLQQAIKLLQLSTLDLQQEIQEALDSNLMLEEVGGEENQTSEETTSLDSPEEAIDNSSNESISAENSNSESNISDEPLPPNPEIDGEAIPDTSDQISSENITEELPVDSVWEDVWDDAPAPSTYTAPDENSDNYLENQNSSSISLKTHLEEQLNVLHLSDNDQLIIMAILDGLNDRGMLTVSLEDIVAAVNVGGTEETDEIELDEVEAMLHLVQHLDPIGVASRDLRETLLIQLNDLPKSTTHRADAILVVDQYLSYLANRDYSNLIRKTRLKEAQLKAAIELIQTLNPRPGSNITASNTEYVEPDVLVTKQNGRWVVELNAKSAPKIRVNADYASMVKRADNSTDNTYLKNHLQEARWFI